jgi:hypothetical protein
MYVFIIRTPYQSIPQPAVTQDRDAAMAHPYRISPWREIELKPHPADTEGKP